jgi:phosphohistidine phosphatase
VLEVAGWPDREGSVVVVGHQPTLGQAAALALCGKIFDLDIEKGALWWLVGNPGAPKPRLRLAIAPDML